MGQCLIVPSVGRRNIARTEWPDIWRFKHLLQLLDFFDNALNVHRCQYSEPALRAL